MPKSSRICIELPFNRNISYSQRTKTKEFWNFLDSDTNLEPYEVPSDENDAKKSDTSQIFPVRIKGMWHDQFKIFQEHKLDKVALAAYESCKLCSTKYTSGTSSTDNTEESYEELQRDMQAFEKKLNDKKKNSTNATRNKSSSP